MEQLPNHICIAILEAEVHIPDVARMVLWAAMAGIQWITVWDPHGKPRASMRTPLPPGKIVRGRVL